MNTNPITLLSVWASGGAKVDPGATKIAGGWGPGNERPALEWENYVRNRDHVRINELIARTNDLLDYVGGLINALGFDPATDSLVDSLLLGNAMPTGSLAPLAVTPAKLATVPLSKVASTVETEKITAFVGAVRMYLGNYRLQMTEHSGETKVTGIALTRDGLASWANEDFRTQSFAFHDTVWVFASTWSAFNGHYEIIVSHVLEYMHDNWHIAEAYLEHVPDNQLVTVTQPLIVHTQKVDDGGADQGKIKVILLRTAAPANVAVSPNDRSSFLNVVFKMRKSVGLPYLDN